MTLALLVATMLLWGTTPILEKMGLRGVTPLTGVLIRSLTVTVVLSLFYLFTGRLHEVARVGMRDFLFFAASGLMAGLIGMWTYLYVLKSGMVSKIVPIAAAYPLVTALASVLMLGEEVTLQRLVGIVLAVTGIILINQS